MKFTRIALMAVAFAMFAASCGSEGNVFSLDVGQCFGSVDTGLISDVPMVECSEPHENEVFAVFDVVGDTLPDTDEMGQGCVERFKDAIGSDYDTSEIYIDAILPSGESFDKGDREVVCYAFDVDDNLDAIERTGSLLGAAR